MHYFGLKLSIIFGQSQIRIQVIPIQSCVKAVSKLHPKVKLLWSHKNVNEALERMLP